MKIPREEKKWANNLAHPITHLEGKVEFLVSLHEILEKSPKIEDKEFINTVLEQLDQYQIALNILKNYQTRG